MVIQMKYLSHIPIPKKGLNLGFTHVCQRCHAYWDGKMWSWDVSPAKNYCPSSLRHEEFDLDNLKMEIRRATPVRYRRAKIWVKRPNAKIIITSEERHQCFPFIISTLNHEFLHWIICLLTKTKPKLYDDYLKVIECYNAERLMEEML